MCFGETNIQCLFVHRDAPAEERYTIYGYHQAATLCDFLGIVPKSVFPRLEILHDYDRVKEKDGIVGVLVIYHQIAMKRHDHKMLCDLENYIRGFYYPLLEDEKSGLTRSRRAAIIHVQKNKMQISIQTLYYDFSRLPHIIPEEGPEQNAAFLIEFLGWCEGPNEHYGYTICFK